MFMLDITCEDSRVIGTEHRSDVDGTEMVVGFDLTLIDNHSGKTHKVPAVPFCKVEKLIAGMICCHGEVPPESYPELEELLVGCPNECRPIP